MASIAVFLASRMAQQQIYHDAIDDLGQCFIQHHDTLIYGGSSEGLMGQLARTILAQDGTVYGCIPYHLMAKEKPLDALHKLELVDNIGERIAWMARNADSFVVFPGGLGTLEEFLVLWNALKTQQIAKPIAILNVNQYFKRFFAFIDDMIAHGFLEGKWKDALLIEKEPQILWSKLQAQLR